MVGGGDPAEKVKEEKSSEPIINFVCVAVGISPFLTFLRGDCFFSQKK